MERLIVKYDNDQELKDALRKNFIRYIPIHLEWASQNNYGEAMKELCNHLDYFEYHYRRYVIGIHRNLRRVNDEIRNLSKSSIFNSQSISSIIQQVEKDILDNELYELMSRHLQAKKKITNFIRNIPEWQENPNSSTNNDPPEEECPF